MNRQSAVVRETEKRLRTVLALFLLAMAAALAVLLVLYPKQYRPETRPAGDGGFVALCYAGVGRAGADGTVTPERLREQLSALRAEGYVTVGREQVASYLETGAQLPEKALYLMFADGRGETALFADRVLRDLNFRAAFMTEAAASPWAYEQLPEKQRAAYLESGFWEEKLPGFAEGAGINLRGSDLTWMRPGNDWSANHLLMRLAQARGDRFPAEGVTGWDSLSGCLATDGTRLTLTSPAGQPGMARLQVGGAYRDWLLETQYLGTGEQSVYLRADRAFHNFVRLTWNGSVMTGVQRDNGKDDQLFTAQVAEGPVSVSLNGGELRVTQDGATVAWTRTTVKGEGYLCLEALPGEEGDPVGDGVFRLSVSRPEGKKIVGVYSTIQPFKWGALHVRTAWNAAWEWLRMAL